MKTESPVETTDEHTFDGQRRCSAVNKQGQPCGSQPPRGQSLCNMHGPRGREYQVKAQQAAAEASRQRKCTRAPAFRDLLSAAVEENRVEIVERLIRFLRSGSSTDARWAIDTLLDRQLGKPRTDSSPVVLEQPHYATKEEALALVAALRGNGGTVQGED